VHPAILDPRSKSLPVGWAGPQAKFHYRFAALQFPAHPPTRYLLSPNKTLCNAVRPTVQPEKQVHHCAPATFFISFSDRTARACLPDFAGRYAKLPVRFATIQFACSSARQALALTFVFPGFFNLNSKNY
jgi:hypothetical protein